jgi:hypothetical protein
MYLVVIMDWARSCVLAWRLSNTLDASFCVAALEEALTKGKPEIFNTDQDAQFTSAAFNEVLRSAGIAISMDGRGRWMDNVFVERLWRSLKYEEIHLRDDANALEARAARLWACGRPKGVAHMPRGPTAAAKSSLIRQQDNPSRRQSYLQGLGRGLTDGVRLTPRVARQLGRPDGGGFRHDHLRARSTCRNRRCRSPDRGVGNGTAANAVHRLGRDNRGSRCSEIP